MSEELKKATTVADIQNDPNYLQVLDHGFVGLVEVMGTDQTIEQSARVSYGAGTRKITETRGILRYLLKQGHSSPMEMAEVRLHVKVPIFVWRQWIRHRTANVNEYSGRYSVMPNEFYIPELSRITGQSSTNKQGGGEYLDPKTQQEFQNDLKDFSDGCYGAYQTYIDKGVAKETARLLLPINWYTEAYWKCDLHNLLHFLKLRLDSHAQYEIQEYARAIHQLVSPKFPIVFEAFEDYSLCATKLSKKQMQLLALACNRESLKDFVNLAVGAGSLSKREGAELVDIVTKGCL